MLAGRSLDGLSSLTFPRVHRSGDPSRRDVAAQIAYAVMDKQRKDDAYDNRRCE